MIDVEEIDSRRVLAFDEANFQFPHESGDRHPEIIPDHHDALDSSAVALAKGLNQLGVSSSSAWRGAIARTGQGRSAPSVPCGMPCPTPQRRQRLFEVQVAGKAGQRLRSPWSSRVSVSSTSPRHKPAGRARPTGEASLLSRATIFRSPKDRRSVPHGTSRRGRSARCGFSKSGCCRAAHLDPVGQAAVPRKSRHPGHRRIAVLWERS